MTVAREEGEGRGKRCERLVLEGERGCSADVLAVYLTSMGVSSQMRCSHLCHSGLMSLAS